MWRHFTLCINCNYGSECWAITKVDARRIDALDQWCLRTLLGIKWHQSVCNEEVRRITKQPNLTAIIQLRHLSIFGHIARMDDDADSKMILMAPPPTGRDHQGNTVSHGWTLSSEIWEPTTSLNEAMWPGPRPTSVPSGILIHPAVWPQQTWAKNWGLYSFFWGGGSLVPI